MLTQDLFMAKSMLRQALFVVLDCTNGIRTLNVIVTQVDITTMNKQRQILRQQQKKGQAAAAANLQNLSPDQILFKQLLRQLSKLFDNFCRNLALKAIEPEDENATAEDGTATAIENTTGGEEVA